MIILRERNLIILTPPKTASETLHRALCSPAHGGYYVVAADPLAETGYSRHACVIPDEAAGMRVLGVVRHPLDRLVSLYHHHQRGEAHEGRAGLGFPDFVTAACAAEETIPTVSVWFRMCLSDWYAKVTLAQTLRVEHLATDLEREGIPAALTWENASFRRPWPDYLSGETLELAKTWSRRDADAYGYALKRE